MSVIDRQKLMERVGESPELLVELIQLFLELGPTMLADIKTSIENNSADDLHRAAHTLKGSVGNFAADDAFQAALLLETIGRNSDLSGVQEAYAVLEREMSRLIEELMALKIEFVSPQ
ncbi:MAG: Hpt domain-containing protein [Deltaproteobacteria bacterium]|nr:Hpt domain-containing protein [Deltaproteobacteria bacterium]